MNKNDTEQAIIGFIEFMKGIIDQDLEILKNITKENDIEPDGVSNSLESEE